jgi:prepilin-type N-terminal cleavage/methylation domain-containing protein
MNIYMQIKGDRGVTLTELLVVISIVAILAVSLGFSFQGWMGNYRIESEIKQTYADIMDARTRAMTQNRMHFVTITANSYTLYEDANDNNCLNVGSGDNPIQTTSLKYAMGWTGTLGFDTRGLAWQYTTLPCTRVSTAAAEIDLPVTLPSDAHPDFNCLAVYQSRVTMGKMSGSYCINK